MNDGDWQNVGKGMWAYVDTDISRWLSNRADIVVHGKGEWSLFINRQHIGTFSSWEEARDATPMMIKLHGYESQS
jgi:hypothetical protein